MNLAPSETREESITALCDGLEHSKRNGNTIDQFKDSIITQPIQESFLPSFSEYNDFVKAFYDDEVDDQRVQNATNVYCVSWHNCMNILGMNSAMISNGIRNKNEIIDIVSLSGLSFDGKLPTIAIAHHSPNDLCEPVFRRLKQLLREMKVKAYLCGDRHLSEAGALKAYGDIVENQIPYLICGKTAIEQADDYSDVNVLSYRVKKDGRTYVRAIKYDSQKGHYVSADNFEVGFEESYSFKLFEHSRRDYSFLFEKSEQFDTLSKMFSDMQNVIDTKKGCLKDSDVFGFGMDLQFAEPWVEEVGSLCRQAVKFRALVLPSELFRRNGAYDPTTLEHSLTRLEILKEKYARSLISLEVRQSKIPYPFFGIKLDNYLYFSWLTIEEDDRIVYETPFYRIALEDESLQNSFIKSFITWFNYIWGSSKALFASKTEKEETES